MTFNVDRVRSHFPALSSDAVYFDNPGGTQITEQALERIQQYLLETNANHGGAFPTSRASDATVDRARSAVADFLVADRPEEIVFGANMTSLTLALSRSLAEELSPGDEIVVTRLDHDGNISPWLQAARASGAEVRWVDFDVEDCTLDMRSFEAALTENTRLVAVGAASNAVGTINPVADIAAAAHDVGALCFVDAVQYAPHRPIDVQSWDCDFLAISAYKFFGPHVGILYGRYELLERLKSYKVRPAPDDPPGKWETGTPNFEGIAGVLGSLEYMAELGQHEGGPFVDELSDNYQGLQLDLKLGMTAIEAYERKLTHSLQDVLRSIPEVDLYGLSEESLLDRRVPTFGFRVADLPPRRIAEILGDLGIYVWDGNFYAQAVTERLGLEEQGGLVRVGLVHYNKIEEIKQLENGLRAALAG
ncbi:MAG: cysteine desulfurase-like protein [Anaerolineales bacterium]|nr:cysteine desulfurase-like protein [Anaerolineales bacterium]